MTLTKVRNQMISGAAANVLDFGADPTGAADSTVAIQAALDAHSKVYFPAGTYDYTALTLNENQFIDGDGRASILNCTNTASSNSVTALGTSGNLFNGLLIDNIFFKGNGSDGIGIRLVYCTRNCSIGRSVWVEGFGGNGINIEGSVGVDIQADIKNCGGVGVLLTEPATTGVCSGNRVTNSHITGNDGGGVKLLATSAGGTVFSNEVSNCIIESNNVAATSGSGVICDGAWQTRLSDNLFESAFDSHILLSNASGYKCHDTIISYNKFSNSGSPTQVYDIDINGADDTIIETNLFPISGPTSSVREQNGVEAFYLGHNHSLSRTGSGVTQVRFVTGAKIDVDTSIKGPKIGKITTLNSTATYAVLSTDEFINVNVLGNVILNLPAASDGEQVLTVKHLQPPSGTGATITRAGSDTIDGATTNVLGARYKYVTLLSDGSSKWSVVADN